MTLRRQFTDLEVAEKFGPELIEPMETVKRKAIESALILCQGNQALAARKLGISRNGLLNLQRQYLKEDQQALRAAAGV